MFDHLRPEKGAIYLTAPDGEIFRALERPPGLTDVQFTLSSSLCREVVGKGMAALVHDLEADARFAEALERELEEFVRGVPFADDRTLVLLRRVP